jgi:catechol 2,3-dioxygenase-like lactoylglutathione lyase family enzyme
MLSHPMIAVRDVEASSAWYQRLLGCKSDHGGSEFDRLVDGETVLLLLHHWNAPEHPSLGSPDAGPVGRGLILWFEVEDLDAVYRRARDLGAEILRPPAHNPRAHHREFTLRDPDGYVVSVCH